MKTEAKSLHSDRFIPVRGQSAPKNCLKNNLSQSNANQDNNRLEALSQQSLSTKQFSLTQSISTKSTGIRDFVQNTIPKSTISSKTIPTLSPYQIIDAVRVVDDHYYNILDVAQNDLVAIGLNHKLWMMKGKDKDTFDFTKDKRKSSSLISSIKISSSGPIVFSGNEAGQVEVYDIQKILPLRIFAAHKLRIGRIENHNTEPSLIFTGSKDHDVKIHDLRIKQTVVDTYNFQKSQVTGLTLKDYIMATGHNNGKVTIWDIRNKKQLAKLQNHSGAVKALSWCPWKQNTLVSGGGKNDTEIIVYNSIEQKIQARIPSKNQISEICWRSSTRQMIYSESRCCENYVRVGKIHMSNYFNQRAKKLRFEEMDGRILGMKINPSSDNVLISVSGNEQLAYWDLDKVDQKINVSDIMESINLE